MGMRLNGKVWGSDAGTVQRFKRKVDGENGREPMTRKNDPYEKLRPWDGQICGTVTDKNDKNRSLVWEYGVTDDSTNFVRKPSWKRYLFWGTFFTGGFCLIGEAHAFLAHHLPCMSWLPMVLGSFFFLFCIVITSRLAHNSMHGLCSRQSG